MRTANYSELRNNLKHYLDGVINDSEPLLVHRPGNESVFGRIQLHQRDRIYHEIPGHDGRHQERSERNRKWKLLFAT